MQKLNCSGGCGKKLNFCPYVQTQLNTQKLEKVTWICDKCYKKKKENTK